MRGASQEVWASTTATSRHSRVPINELVFLIQGDGFVPVQADVRIEEPGGEGFSLEASLTGASLDVEGHGWQGEIKSATFHGLDVTPGNEGWQAQVILDV